MDVTRTRALRGPNLWSRHMAIEAVVACAESEQAISRMDGFEARLRALFPAIGMLHPEGGSGDVSLAHVLQTAALALQAQALDLLAEELRLAQNALNEITGEFSSDDLLGVIFSSFCIGK